MSRSREVYKQDYYSNSRFPGGGTQRIDIKEFQETIKKGIEGCASEIVFEYSNDRLQIYLYQTLTEEEVLQEDIQQLTAQLKQKSKDLLKIQGKITNN
jgi:hypothetical protein